MNKDNFMLIQDHMRQIENLLYKEYQSSPVTAHYISRKFDELTDEIRQLKVEAIELIEEFSDTHCSIRRISQEGSLEILEVVLDILSRYKECFHKELENPS